MIRSPEGPTRWANVLPFLQHQSFHQDFEIEKWRIEHPINDGFEQSVGELKGQSSDWRKTLADGSCIHVLEYPARYVYPRDVHNPNSDPLGHLLDDAPHWLFLIVLVIVGIVIAVAMALISRWRSGE
jgi:hypothetical protein